MSLVYYFLGHSVYLCAQTCVVGSSLEWRNESGEPRVSVRASTARPSEPRQLVRLQVDAAGPTLYTVQAAHRAWRAQDALYG